MSSTILTVMVLVVMWVVVLVPMLVRRHEDEMECVAEDQDTAGPDAPVCSPALRRRRRTLGTLFGLAVVAVPLALVVTAWAWVAQVAADLLICGYLVWLRKETRRAAERRRQQAARMEAARTRAAAPRLVQGGLSRAQPGRVVGLDDDDPTFAEIEQYTPRAVNQ